MKQCLNIYSLIKNIDPHMNYSDQNFTNLYTFTVLIILLLSIHKQVQETLLLTQDFPNSDRLLLCSLVATCKPSVYFVGWIGGWALSVLFPRRGLGPLSSTPAANSTKVTRQ